MRYLGIDTAARITADQAKKLRENGVSFVGRYLVPETCGKALTAAEAAILRGAGLAILLCWELDAAAMKGGSVRGAQDGSQARKLAEAMKLPAGTCIYFAADYFVPAADYSAVEQYMKAAQTALTARYEAGFYGPLNPVLMLAERGVCRKFWQCVAWSAYFSEQAQTWQYQWDGSDESKAMAAATGIAAVDMDTCDDLRKAGMWMPYNEYADGDGTVIETPAAPQKPWYEGDMAWVKKNGLMNDGRPNDYVTRAELAAVVHRLEEKRHSGLLED